MKENREPWGFCETPEEKCTMNYCDDNGCQNRKRNCVNNGSIEVNILHLNNLKTRKRNASTITFLNKI